MGKADELDYLVLFDAIDKQKKYDEERLSKDLKGHKILKNISAAKNRLFEVIMRSLSEYHFDKSVDSQLNNLLSYSRILQGKGLHRQAGKYLKKASELATRHEKFTRMLEIVEQQKLMTLDMRLGGIDEGLSPLAAHEHKTVNRMLNKGAYMQAFFDTQKLYKNEKYLRSPEKVKLFIKILDRTIFKKEDEALSTYSKNIFYELHALHFWNISEPVEAYKLKKRQLQLWLSDPEMAAEQAKTYINLLSDFLYISYHAGQLQELTTYIKVLRETETNDLELQQKIFVESSIFSLIYHQQHGDYETCLNILKQVKTELPNYEETLNVEDKNRIYISSSIIAFGGEDYSQALWWINKILNMHDLEMREDIHCFARIFNLFIHFELDDGRLLEYIIQSTYRFLSKRKKLFMLEKAVIKFLKKMINADDRYDLAILFASLREEFIKINEDAYEKKFFKVFDFITWLDAKLSGRKYRELVKEKAIV